MASYGRGVAASVVLDASREKRTVRCAATGNVNVASAPAAGDAVWDGQTLAANDRVLLPSQTAGAENGIRVWRGAGVAMDRASDWTETAEVMPGAEVYTRAGTLHADKSWYVTSEGTGEDAAHVVGTDPVTILRGSAIPGGGGSAETVVAIGAAQSPYAPTVNDTLIRVTTSGGAVFVDLPAASNRSTSVAVVNEDGINAVTVRTNAAVGYSGTPGADLFNDGASTRTLLTADHELRFTPHGAVNAWVIR